MSRRRRTARFVVLSMTVVIIVVGAYGFGSKFEEFVRAFLAKDTAPGGEFVFIPVLNYFIASLGFVCLFIWAARNGMFKDIEKPKYTMLDQERQIDESEGIRWESSHER